jgi:hypothetical protein
MNKEDSEKEKGKDACMCICARACQGAQQPGHAWITLHDTYLYHKPTTKGETLHSDLEVRALAITT